MVKLAPHPKYAAKLARSEPCKRKIDEQLARVARLRLIYV